MALAVSNVIAIICACGLDNAVVRIFFDTPTHDRKTDWGLVVVLQMLLAAVVAIAAFMTVGLWGPLFGTSASSLAIWKLAVLLAAAMSVSLTLQGVLRAQQRPSAFVMVVGVQATSLGLTAIPFTNAFGPTGYVGAVACASVAAAITALYLTKPRPLWRSHVVHAAALMGVAFAFHSAAGWVLNLSDRLLIGRYLGTAAAGRYYLVYVIATVPLVLFESFHAAWIPTYYAASQEAKEMQRRRLAQELTSLAACVAVIAAAASPVVLRFAAPAGYGRPYILLAVISMTVVVRPLYFISLAILIDAKKSRWVAASSVTSAAANVGVNLLFVPRFGVVTAAVSTVLAFTLAAVIGARVAYGSLRNVEVVGCFRTWLVAVAILGAVSISLVSGVWLIAGIIALAASAIAAAPSRAILRHVTIRMQPTAPTPLAPLGQGGV